MTTARPEQRRDKRLNLQLPVKFSVEADQSTDMLDGVTHNVSSGGAYFEAPAAQVTPEGLVSVRIGVPARQDEKAPNLILVGKGTVKRVEPLESGQALASWPEAQRAMGVYGIAVAFEDRPTIQLRSFEDLLWENPQAGEGFRPRA
jgi:hypothetical protein